MEEPTTTVNTLSSSQIIQNNGRFHGSGGEFFGIWIVNLLLSIVTLGIYSAWATVRTRKYFYRNTELAGSRFDFHGKPIPILIGRIIGISLFGLYSFGAYIHGLIPLAVYVLVILAFPWLFAKSWTFRLRNTSWRGIHFDFRGQVGDLYRRLGLYILVFAALQGLILYFALGPNEHILWLLFGSLILILIMIPMIYSALMDTAVNHTYIGNDKFQLLNLQSQWICLFWQTYIIYITMMVIVFSIAGISVISLALFQDDSLNIIIRTIIGIIIYLFVIIASVIPLGFWQVGKFNLLFGNTHINDATFNNRLKVDEYINLLFTNALLTAFTFGLAYPWVAVRIARYQIEHIGFYGDTDQFSGAKVDDTNALGEEVASAFDMEIGL
jgi:uncharacterized membrane protein YjgN (DUF898 family)